MTVDCSLHTIIMTIFLVHRAGGCSMLPLLHVSIAAIRSRLRLSQEWGSQHLEKKAFPYVVRWRHLTITDIRRISCYFVSKCCLQYLFLVLDGVGRNQLTVNLLPKLLNGGAPNLTFLRLHPDTWSNCLSLFLNITSLLQDEDEWSKSLSRRYSVLPQII